MRFADSADDNDKLGGGTEKYKTKIAINSNGSCKWMAPAIFQSTCDINTEFFPFDDQVRYLLYVVNTLSVDPVVKEFLSLRRDDFTCFTWYVWFYDSYLMVNSFLHRMCRIGE